MTSPANSHGLDALVEAVAGAWRPREPQGTIRFHPGWYDLDDKARLEAHDAARASRAIEAGLDPQGLSTTARAVLARIRGR